MNTHYRIHLFCERNNFCTVCYEMGNVRWSMLLVGLSEVVTLISSAHFHFHLLHHMALSLLLFSLLLLSLFVCFRRKYIRPFSIRFWQTSNTVNGSVYTCMSFVDYYSNKDCMQPIHNGPKRYTKFYL